MKKYLIYAGLFLLPFLAVYLLGSFAVLSFNLHNWDLGGRLVGGAFALGFGLFSINVKYENDAK